MRLRAFDRAQRVLPPAPRVLRDLAHAARMVDEGLYPAHMLDFAIEEARRADYTVFDVCEVIVAARAYRDIPARLRSAA